MGIKMDANDMTVAVPVSTVETNGFPIPPVAVVEEVVESTPVVEEVAETPVAEATEEAPAADVAEKAPEEPAAE